LGPRFSRPPSLWPEHNARDALRIVEVGECSGLAIVWIGVEFGALGFEEGSVVALECRTFIDRYWSLPASVPVHLSNCVKGQQACLY
jgi:hypothetical protein